MNFIHKSIHILCIALTLVAAGPAQASLGIGGAYAWHGVAATRCSDLGTLAGVTGAVFDVDATCGASYPGSGQTWANLVAAPADGSGQTAYDFYLGVDGSASSDDPTFNGTPDDPGAYFSFDGGDRFVLAGGNTPYTKNLHKTTGGTPATIILAVQTPPSYSATAGYFGTTTSTSADGIEMRITSGSVNQFIQRAASTNGLSTPFSSTPSAGAVHLMVFAFDFTGGTFKTALDARSFTSKTLVSHASTNDASNTFGLGWGSGNDTAVNGTRFYGAYAFNKILSDAELSAVVDALNTRHSRAYAAAPTPAKTRYAGSQPIPFIKPERIKVPS